MNMRFLQFKIEHNVNEIYSKMNANQFSKETESGFLIDSNMNNRVDGRYIHRKTVETVDADPFGNEIINSFTSYDIYDFSLDKQADILLLQDSPRDIKFFINKLNTLFDYRITIENLRINLLQFAEYLEDQLQDCFLTSVEINDIYFSALTTGKVIIKGKEGIGKYLDDATYHRKQYHVTRIGIQATFMHRVVTLEISERGVIRFVSTVGKRTVQNEMAKILKNYLQMS